MKRTMFLGLLLYGAIACVIVCLVLIGIDQYNNWETLRTPKQYFNDHIPAACWGLAGAFLAAIFFLTQEDED